MFTQAENEIVLPVTLGAGLIPLDGDGQYVPHHVDASGTVHWFSIVGVREGENPNNEPYQLRYYRATQDERGEIVHDSYPVMPLADQESSPFPLPVLQLMLEDGDLANAQEIAQHSATLYGLSFPDPVTLPDLNPRPDYYFGRGLAEDGSPSLEAVKTWMEGSERRTVTQIIATYGTFDEAEKDEQQLQALLKTEGLEQAMNLAERLAVASGQLHDGRENARLFTEGPRDSFQTILERQRAAEAVFFEANDDRGTQTPVAVIVEADQSIQTFREHFGTSVYRLLEPVDPSVNYSFAMMAADPWTLELTAEKWWLETNGPVGHDSLTLNTYPLEGTEVEDATQRELGAIDCEMLNRIYTESGLEAAMRQAEGIAVANDELDPNREDGRLFHGGPPDRFTTLREAELAGLDSQPMALRVRDITPDDTQEIPTDPEPGSWEELLAQYSGNPPEPERHYWQMHYRPVETPTGERLGTALFVTEFPQLPSDFDDFVEENGMDDSIYPTEARTVEMAHFSSNDHAHKFEAEFRGYLVPGLLDGPELAPEVAKLEGLSGEWEEMDYWGIARYMSGNRTVVREADEWFLHNPNSEREAREQLRNSQNDIDL